MAYYCQIKAYLDFCSIKWLGVLLSTPPGCDASPSQVTSQHFVSFPWQFAGTHLLLAVERHCENKVSCPRTQHNDPARAQTRTSRSRVSALTTRLPRLPLVYMLLPLPNWQICCIYAQQLCDISVNYLQELSVTYLPQIGIWPLF